MSVEEDRPNILYPPIIPPREIIPQPTPNPEISKNTKKD